MTSWAVRVEGPDDADAIHAVLSAAFGRPDEADLVRALRADPAWALGLVAEDAGTVTGHIAFTGVRVDDAPALALAPLAVRPEYQGQGIGSALARAGLDWARSTGAPAVIVLGDPAYYGRFGFEPAARWGITGPFGEIPEFQALVLHPPAPSGRVRYAAPFGA